MRGGWGGAGTHTYMGRVTIDNMEGYVISHLIAKDLANLDVVEVWSMISLYDQSRINNPKNSAHLLHISQGRFRMASGE